MPRSETPQEFRARVENGEETALRARIAELEEHNETLLFVRKQNGEANDAAHARIAELENAVSKSADWLKEKDARIAELEAALRELYIELDMSPHLRDIARRALERKP